MTKASPNKASKAKAGKAPKTKKQTQKARRPRNRVSNGTTPESNSKAARMTKSGQCLALLRRSEGTTIAELMTATGWQSHSVRGFLSGAVKRKLGLTVTSAVGQDGIRRYHVTKDEA